MNLFTDVNALIVDVLSMVEFLLCFDMAYGNIADHSS